MSKLTSVEMRLFRRRQISSTTGCWLWGGDKTNRTGYGRIFVRGRGKQMVHRVSYECFVGPISNGLSVLHKCDVPACFNPEHLFLGTLTDNMRDMVRKGRGVVPSAKLSPEIAKVIRGLSRRYGLINELSRQFNVDRRTIRCVRNGTSWQA